MDTISNGPVLILGAGINGAAVARDLVLNGVPVWVVDANDVAFGATSKSSRLIHGGLRYLEYGDFRLVRESLAERTRLRRLAPQFVEPLRLYIPVARRTGSLWRSVTRFLGAARTSFLSRLALPGRRERGLWLVRIGLWFYDRFARDPEFAGASVHRVSEPGVPHVDRSKYRWLCAYSDGQMRYPERFVLALLEDARQLAAERGVEFRVLTHHRATLADGVAGIRHATDPDAPSVRVSPQVVVNATGAWGDLTLRQLSVPAPRLFGGTKGSHFITYQPGLKNALGDDGLYAEAADGRLIFILPFGHGVLVGTTDERFEGPPDRAVASEDELAYLIGMVNALFPQTGLTRADIELHYSGVRPLPAVQARRTGAIPRDHHVETHEKGGLCVLTLIGGKLTTCRLFAEQVTDEVLRRLGRERVADTRDRVVPGGEAHPPDARSLHDEVERVAAATGFAPAQVAAVWALCGRRAEVILRRDEAPSDPDAASDPDAGSVRVTSPQDVACLPGTDLPLVFVRHVIAHEWAATLADLVERRLMLVYQPALTRQTLDALGDLLVEAGRLAPAQTADEVTHAIHRLREHYGKTVVG